MLMNALRGQARPAEHLSSVHFSDGRPKGASGRGVREPPRPPSSEGTGR